MEQFEDTVDEEILWFKWELVSGDTEGAKKKVTSCVSHKTSFAEFIEEFEKDLTKYPSHIFRAQWQHKQMQTVIEKLEKDKLVMLMDYSETYRCRFQNESQNAYFD